LKFAPSSVINFNHPPVVDWLTEPFSAEFMQTAALAAAIVGALCGVVGCFVILRGLALVADSLAHGVLPGIAIAFIVTANGPGEDPSSLVISLGALLAGLATAFATAAILRRTRLREETAAAVVFVLMLALGVALISSVEGYAVDLNSFLFGDVLGVEGTEIAVAAVLSALVVAAVVVLYRPLIVLCFDEQRAAAMGIPIGAMNVVLLTMVTLAVVIGFRVVGSLLVLGMLIAPPAAASLLTRRLPTMMACAAAIAAASAPVGLLVSWHLEIAAGASIVLVAVACFLAAATFRLVPS
jgi:ABC-type Mn2+/Zn2+ transport system permease subunit